MLKKYQTVLYSTGGIVAVFVILVLANFVLGAVKQRIDLTEGGIYTLSEGTRDVIAKLESPVKIRFYFSQSDASVPLALKAFGRRVEDLLGEFRQASGGKIIVEKLDPEPDSDAEDSAALDGVEAQVTGAGDRFYLGAVGQPARPEVRASRSDARPRTAARIRSHACNRQDHDAPRSRWSAS